MKLMLAGLFIRFIVELIFHKRVKADASMPENTSDANRNAFHPAEFKVRPWRDLRMEW